MVFCLQMVDFFAGVAMINIENIMYNIYQCQEHKTPGGRSLERSFLRIRKRKKLRRWGVVPYVDKEVEEAARILLLMRYGGGDSV